jgi:UDP-glucose 4-epimerase
MKILVPGISGAVARLVATELHQRGHEVAGIDSKPWGSAPEGVKVHVMDIRKRAAEDVFRRMRPDAVVHMATVTHLRERSKERFRVNLQGTRAVFENCAAHGVKQTIFVGRHTYYGAGPESPLYHTESEPPLGAHDFPELADLVASDLYAGSALWRYPQVDTCVLRVCYTLGPGRSGTLASFLRGRRVPMVLGFDPLFQFMHERDVARAIAMATEAKLRGVFNVAGPPPLPLWTLIRAAGRTPIPIPEPILAGAFGRFGLPKLSRAALQHLKYPIVIDATPFKKATGFVHEMDERRTIADFGPPPAR